MTVVKEIGVDGAAVVFLLVVMTLVPVLTVVTCCVVGLVVVLCSVVVTVIGTSHSFSTHISSDTGLSSALHHFSSISSIESARHLILLRLTPWPHDLEHGSQG